MPPVYLKTADFKWPQDKMFYLLTADGLFIGRNHAWFQSLAPAKKGPSDLLKQEPQLELSYPILPRALVEKAVSFFRYVYQNKQTESALILGWNKNTQAIELICPEQEVSYASVHYTIPILEPHLLLLGDFHSHCNFSPSPSMTDEGDELNRPGLHLIVGEMGQYSNGPAFHGVVVADGQRFDITDLSLVMEPYVPPKDWPPPPPEWLAKLKEKKYTYHGSGMGGYYDDGYSGSSWFRKRNKVAPKDKAIVSAILTGFLKRDTCPTMAEVRQRLVVNTSVDTSYMVCEEKAQKFVDKWQKAKAAYEKERLKNASAAA